MPAVLEGQWQDATASNPPSMLIAIVWAWVKATMAKRGIAETVELCIQAAKSALRVGHVIEFVKCFS